MEVVYNKTKTKLDLSKRIYECSSCGELFNWDDNSTWYGSYKQLEEEPEKIKYYCNVRCQYSKK